MAIRALRRETPVSRTLIRLGTRFILGRQKAHYYAWCPHLELVRDEAGSQIFYKRRLIGTLLNAAALGGQCAQIYIVGSGPSIRSQNMELLPPSSCLLLNGAIALLGKAIATPLAIVIEDERFVWRHFELMKATIPAASLCLLSPGVIRAACELDSAWLLDKRVVLINDIRKPYMAPRKTCDELRHLRYVRLSHETHAGFSSQPDRGVFQGGSVVVSALQFAIYAKPTSIGLFGVDIGNAEQPRFYETTRAAAKSGIARARQRIVDHIALAETICEEEAIRLSNHSPISALLDYGFGYDRRFALAEPSTFAS